MRMSNQPTKVVVNLPEEGDAELEVSHLVEIGGVEVRVLAEPHQWHLLRSSTDPVSIIKAFIHPEDYSKLDNLLSGRRQVDADTFSLILNALVEKPTGHPTNGSPDSLPS